MVNTFKDKWDNSFSTKLSTQWSSITDDGKNRNILPVGDPNE